MQIKTALRLSILRTLYLSRRHGGRIIVFRGTRIKLEKGARISVAPGARLMLGTTHYGGTPVSLNIQRNARLTIHGDVAILRGTRVIIGEDAHLEIGHQSFINFDSAVTCYEHLIIGANCAISWDVNILDGNGHELAVAGVPRPRKWPVRIGDNVWIGAGASVRASIADGSVVAAGSVVTREVPPKVIVGGNPARVIREDVTWRL